ncbi:unnamed protein product [Anisakis simplex]|uniref:SET domain-containing protein n=1 Tax=Anisakis simplex TaxID=6269 RepID=A0A0M3JQZ4_ANISI|nr:unnamed protein product [Anisakis simplex]
MELLNLEDGISMETNNRLCVRRINNEETKMNETNAERSFEEANDYSDEVDETISKNEIINLQAKAAEYVRLKKWDDAEEMYAKAIEICPDVYATKKQDLYDQHIECSMNLSLWEEAISDCVKLLQFNASNETVQKRCAMCYVNLMKSAIESFENCRLSALNNPIQFFTKEFHNIRDIPNESYQYEMKRFGLKDSVVSEELRKLGNEYYVSGNFTKALRVYFEAFDTAVQSDLTYFLAMKNIATVLMKIGYPKEALKHFDRLERSAEKNSSDKLNAVLFSKKMKECLRLPQTEFYKTPEQKLYKGANKTCEQISSAVRIQYDEVRGRHLVVFSIFLAVRIVRTVFLLIYSQAAENIPEGMVVIKEVPLVMAASNCVTRCENCNARFCDEKCLEEGASMHSLDHHYGGENGLKSIGMCELIAKAINEYSYDELKRFIEIHRTERFFGHIFNVCVCCNNESYIGEVPNRKDVRSLNGNSFEAIMLLKAYSFDDSSNNIVINQFVDDVCKLLKSKFSDLTSVECRRFIGDVTRELMKRIPLNANAIHQNPKLLSRCPNDLYETLLSVALLPIASTVNHSCAPNLYHSCSGTDECCFILRTVREIRAGEELLCSYGPLAGCHTYEQRRKLLLEQYDFVCECEVCRHEGDHQLDKVIIGRFCVRCKRMNSTKSLCGTKHLEEMKKCAFEARQLFRTLYGKGNLRDLEIDFMLSAARRAITEK